MQTMTNSRPVRGGAIITAMTRTMIELGEGCTDRDLKRHGFSQTDIDRYGKEAGTRAAVQAGLN